MAEMFTVYGKEGAITLFEGGGVEIRTHPFAAKAHHFWWRHDPGTGKAQIGFKDGETGERWEELVEPVQVEYSAWLARRIVGATDAT